VRVLVTGAGGFIGRNLLSHLSRREDVEVIRYTRDDHRAGAPLALDRVDFVFHLAGINRPQDPRDFATGNADFTRRVCDEIADVARATGRRIPVLFTSSTQAVKDNAYGESKRRAEEHLRALAATYEVPVYLFRLPNVFGKWCRPNYNSAVATFCHNLARDLPVQVNDPAAPLRLVYIDDVIRGFLAVLEGKPATPDAAGFVPVEPEYASTVGEVLDLIREFRAGRSTLLVRQVGTGFLRALYSTYVSYLPPESFSYTAPKHEDPRGVFVEMLKTTDSGQFSYFTAHPGVTRGGHYHHTKTEKFLVIRGRARFRFRHIDTGETRDLTTDGAQPEIVETVPGWAHDITNIGADEMVVMLWANEIFDRQNPDTYASTL
jgi:UDP-2-acetamido-2,6-beta-L-arabino-hexul-4-ose reductase